MNAQLLEALFAVIAPVFIAAALGYGWAKRGWPMDTHMITRLVTLIGTPALVLHTLTSVDLSPASLGHMALIAASAMLSMALLAFGVMRLLRWPISGYLPSMVFANIGNMGLPLCLFAFGQEGLALAIAYFTVGSVSQFVFGPAAASGKLNIMGVLKTPIIWAVLLAVILMVAGISLPKWAANTLNLMGGMSIPLMLLMLGVSLGKLSMAGMGRCLVLSILRLVGGFAIGMAIVVLFDLKGVERGVVLIQSSMPVAVFNYLFAVLHDNRPTEVAGMVLLSTTLSFLTLPFLLAYVL